MPPPFSSDTTVPATSHRHTATRRICKHHEGCHQMYHHKTVCHGRRGTIKRTFFSGSDETDLQQGCEGDRRRLTSPECSPSLRRTGNFLSSKETIHQLCSSTVVNHDHSCAIMRKHGLFTLNICLFSPKIERHRKHVCTYMHMCVCVQPHTHI